MGEEVLRQIGVENRYKSVFEFSVPSVFSVCCAYYFRLVSVGFVDDWGINKSLNKSRISAKFSLTFPPPDVPRTTDDSPPSLKTGLSKLFARQSGSWSVQYEQKNDVVIYERRRRMIPGAAPLPEHAAIGRSFSTLIPFFPPVAFCGAKTS